MQNAFVSETRKLLSFARQVTGCDPTSLLFGTDKGLALRKLSSELAFKREAELFSKEVSLDEIISAGEEALMRLHGGRPAEGLDALAALVAFR